MATPVVINAGQVIYAAQTRILELADIVSATNSLKKVDEEIQLIAKLVRYIETLQNDTSLTFSEQQAICQCMITSGGLFDFPVTTSITSLPQTIVIAQPGAGPQGPQGPIGLTGAQGPTGDTGPQGPAGFIDTLSEGAMLIGNSSNVPTAVTISGDIAIGSDGVALITPNIIVDADISASAAIALTKLAASTADRAVVFGSTGLFEPSATTKAQIGFLSTLSSDVQTQINSKQATITGGASTIATADLTAGRVLISDGTGKVIVSPTITDTLLNFLSGTSSNLQTQIDGKLGATLISPADGDILFRSGGVYTNLGIGTTNEVLTVGVSGLPEWNTGVANGLIAGGTIGQYLKKNSSTDYDVSWDTLTLSEVTDVTVSATILNSFGSLTSTIAELNYSDGVTSPIQGQLDTKMANSLPLNNFFIGNSSNVPAPFAPGTEGQVLATVGGVPTWQTLAGTGTVTSVAVSGGTTGLTTSGGPISTSGTITITGTLAATSGGTGLTSYAIGDIVYASTTTALSKLAGVATGNVLTSGGVGVAPVWGKVTSSHLESSFLASFWRTTGTTALTGATTIDVGANNLEITAPGNGNITLSTQLTGGTGEIRIYDHAGNGIDVLGRDIIRLWSIDVANVEDVIFTLTPTSATFEDGRTTKTGIEYIADYSATYTDRSLVDKGYVNALPIAASRLPNYEIEEVSTTTYTFIEADRFKIKHFTNVAGCTATVPLSLPTGWSTTAYRGSGAGVVTLASSGTLESADTTLDTEKTAATIIHRGTDIHVAIGALGASGGGGGGPIDTTDLPDLEIEDVTTTTYNFVSGDRFKIKRFTHASGCTATIPTGLDTGWSTTVYRADGAGVLTLASAGTFEGAGTTLDIAKTAATIFHRGSDIHVGVGALGGQDFLLNGATTVLSVTDTVFDGVSGTRNLHIGGDDIASGGAFSLGAIEMRSNYVDIKTTASITLDSESGINIYNRNDGQISINAGPTTPNLLFNTTLAQFTDNRATAAGLQYESDYSANYTNRSLVDKEYVDGLGGVTDGDKGQITVTGGGTIWTLDANTVASSQIQSLNWSKLDFKPTTIAGYGITDPIVGSVTGTTNRVTIGGTSSAPTVDIASTYVGQTSITTLGTIATGTWNATNISLAKGGTGTALTDPGGDRVMFWDDSAGVVTWLSMGTNLAISGTTLNATASGGITNGAAANEIMKSDGTNAVASGVFSTVSGDLALGTGLVTTTRTISAEGSSSSVNLALESQNLGDVFITTHEFNVQHSSSGKTYLESTTSNTNTPHNILQLEHITSGTPAAGIGVGMEFNVETASGNFETGASIQAITTDVTSTSEDFDITFNLMAAGAAVAEKFRFASTGTGTATNWAITSDSRLKENIRKIDHDVLNKILTIGALVCEYDRIDSKAHETGFIAQELLKVAPEYVNVPDNPEQMLSVDYGKMTALLFKGFQQLLER